MKTAIVLLPGLNRDRDMIAAIRTISGQEPLTVWQTETEIPAGVDLVIVPGGFSFGDYLRCGAIGARMPVVRAVRFQSASDSTARRKSSVRETELLEFWPATVR